MKRLTREKITVAFVIVYILLPISTGWFEYHRAPNEYDEQIHEVLKSHPEECGPEGLQSCMVADQWRDKMSGEEFSASQYKDRRLSEAIKISIFAFLYGLIACIYYAFNSAMDERDTVMRLMFDGEGEPDFNYLRRRAFEQFISSLKWSTLINCIFVVLIFQVQAG